MSNPKVLSGAGVVAVAACGLVTLSACSSSGSTGASSSSGLTTKSTLTVTSTTPSSTPSVSRSVLHPSASSSAQSTLSSSAKASSSKASSPSASTSGKSSKSAKPTTSKPSVKADPVGACLTANKDSNSAITQWNAAVTSQSKSKLDAAAKNFQTTADNLRKLPATSQDKGFETRVKAVATDLDVMAKAQFDGKSVTTTAYNKDSGTLRSYCQKLITNA